MDHDTRTMANGPGPDPTHPLLLDTIMSQLFKKLEYKDLQTCRLVCHSWDLQALQLLRPLSQYKYETRNYVLDGGAPELREMITTTLERDRDIPFRYGSSLRSLDLYYTADPPMMISRAAYAQLMNDILFEWTPNLEQLELRPWSYYEHDEDNQVPFMLGQRTGRRLENIKSLKVHIDPSFHQQMPWMKALLQCFTNLHELTLPRFLNGWEHCQRVFGEFIVSKESLRSLNVRIGEIRVPPSTDEKEPSYSCLWMYGHCRHLTKLELEVEFTENINTPTPARGAPYVCSLMADFQLNIPKLARLEVELYYRHYVHSSAPPPSTTALVMVGSTKLVNMKSLTLRTQHRQFAADQSIDFVAWMPNLTFLKIHEGHVCPDQPEEVKIKPENMTMLRSQFPESHIETSELLATPRMNLRTLVLESALTSTFVETRLPNLSKYFPNLRAFSIDVVEEEGEATECIVDRVMKIFAQSPRLQEMSIQLDRHNCNVGFGGFPLPQLERLKLQQSGYCDWIDNFPETVPMPSPEFSGQMHRLTSFTLEYFELFGSAQKAEEVSNQLKQRMVGVPFVHIKL